MKSKEEHEILFERLPFVKKFGNAYNISKPERGLIIDLETENGVHYVKLSRHAVNGLIRVLMNAEQDWKNNDGIQNGT